MESLRSEDEYEDDKNSPHNRDRIEVKGAYPSSSLSFQSSSFSNKSLRSEGEDENEYEILNEYFST
jgi:hypothetical protein